MRVQGWLIFVSQLCHFLHSSFLDSPGIPLVFGVSVRDPAGVALLPPEVERQLVVLRVRLAAARSDGAAEKAAESLSPLECG